MTRLKSLCLVVSLTALAGCVTPQQTGIYAPAPVEGQVAPASTRAPQISDCDQIVPIIAKNTTQGNARVDAWLSRNYPNAQKVGRRLTECGGRKAEVITVRNADGVTFNTTFDISSYFGKTSSGDNLDDLLDG